MRSLKVLVFAVVLPALLAVVLSSRLAEDDHREIRVVHAEVERDVDVEVEPAAGDGVEVVVVARSNDRCAHARTEEARLDADGIEGLAVEAGSGTLEVMGSADVDEVVLRSTLCASDEGLMEGLRSELDRDGDRAVVRTRYPSSRGSGNRYARIDLRVLVPLGMPADLEDSSGEIRVSGTGDTRIADASGEIEARGVNGSLDIRDGSGEISLRDIGGDVELIDGSGELDIADVDGEVRLTDGSGSIEITDVTGSVEIRADGSGSIEVSEVGGDFVVRADGSGSITHSRVDGRVDVPRKDRR